MKLFLSILKDVSKFLFSLFAPVILIVLGGLLIGWAIPNEYEIFAWTGLVMVGAGVLWGFILYLYHCGIYFN